MQQNTFNSSLQNETLYINYANNNILLQINTLMVMEIVAINGLRATVTPKILTIAQNQPSPPPGQIENVPLCQLIGGNAGIIINYEVGDTVLCGAIQRDISSIKNNWSTQVPASTRKFNLMDVVVLFKLSNSLPTTYVKITDAGGIEIKTSADQPVVVNTQGDTTVNAKNVDITATQDVAVTAQNATVTASTQASIEAPLVKLGNAAAFGLLLQGIPLTANIGGVSGGPGVNGVPVTVTAGGSTSVLGSI